MNLDELAFEHQSLRTRVVCRPGAVAGVPAEVAGLGCRRPMVLASRRSRGMPAYAALRAALDGAGMEAAESADVPAHSCVASVEAAAALIRAHGGDCLIAFGGGSVSDTAKAAALLAAEGGELARHATRFVPPATIQAPPLLAPKLPIVSIALTASGAEVTPSFGIRAPGGGKLLFWDAQAASRVVVLDAELNTAVPARLMLETGMNALAHCLEGLYSTRRSPIATALALDGLARLDAALRGVAARPDDAGARAALLVAAHISGMVLASARSCLHHALCHVLGAATGAGHGALNAVILPHALAYNLPAAREALAAAARAAGWSRGGDDRAEAAIDGVRALQQAAGVPQRLRDLGIERGLLRGVAGHAMHERGLALNPRRVRDADEIHALLDAAW